MRLLHFPEALEENGRLKISLCEFVGDSVPIYAILSHRWREEEVLFVDMMNPDRSIAESKIGYAKLEAACRMTLQLGMNYVWMDTCCIDKSSSAELSEAINSMYGFYEQSSVCIAYLDDVENDDEDNFDVQDSCWFSRGWTLQELIAPQDVYFYSREWQKLGSKSNNREQLSAATGISTIILRDHPSPLDRISIFEKMSWAVYRVTTREEDESYSLMGLFGVNMPPLYGEGRERAFRRLQLEVMRYSHDHTMFAWNSRDSTGDMLASSVRHFFSQYSYQKMHPSAYCQIFNFTSQDLEYSMTNVGLRIKVPLAKLKLPHRNNVYLAFLACRAKSRALVAICLQRDNIGGFVNFRRIALYDRTVFHIPDLSKYNVTDAVVFISSNYKETGYEIIRGRTLPDTLKIEISCRSQEEAFTSIPDDELRVTSSGCIATLKSLHLLVHDVVIFPHNLWKKRLVCVVFGNINGSIWVYAWDHTISEEITASNAPQIIQDIHRVFKFPSGDAWIRIKREVRIFETDPLVIPDQDVLGTGVSTRSIALSGVKVNVKFDGGQRNLRIEISSK